jgi:hypothetical protein
MASGDDGGDPDEGPAEGPILSPEELDIADDEHVLEIDEGRYVVLPDGRPDADVTSPGPVDVEAEPGTPDADPADSLDEATVHEWLREQMAASSSRYGFDVTATFDGTVSHQQIASNDIVTVFETMLLWYARQVDSDTPVEQVIGILLMESNVPVRYPATSLETLIDSVGVDEDDSVGTLIEALEEEDGIQL